MSSNNNLQMPIAPASVASSSKKISFTLTAPKKTSILNKTDSLFKSSSKIAKPKAAYMPKKSTKIPFVSIVELANAVATRLGLAPELQSAKTIAPHSGGTNYPDSSNVIRAYTVIRQLKDLTTWTASRHFVERVIQDAKRGYTTAMVNAFKAIQNPNATTGTHVVERYGQSTLLVQELHDTSLTNNYLQMPFDRNARKFITAFIGPLRPGDTVLQKVNPSGSLETLRTPEEMGGSNIFSTPINAITPPRNNSGTLLPPNTVDRTGFQEFTNNMKTAVANKQPLHEVPSPK